MNVNDVAQILLEQNPACVVITDPDGRIEYVNPQFVELTGYSSDEVSGKNPSILKDPGRAPEATAELWPTLKSGRIWNGTFRNRKKSGDVYWESARIAPVLDNRGRVIHYVAVKQDITQQVLARKRAEKLNDELQAIYGCVPAQIALFNRELKVISANQALVDLAAHDIRQVLGSTACGFLGCVGLMDDPRGCGFGKNCQSCDLYSALTDTLETGQMHRDIEYHVSLLRDRGLENYIFSATTTRFELAGELVVLLFLIDITARKQAEETTEKQSRLIQAQNAEYQAINENLTLLIDRLEDSEQRFHVVMSTINGYIYFKEFREGECTYAYHSPGCLKMTGYSVEELQADSDLWFSMIHEDDKELVLAYIDKIHHGQTISPVEYRIRRRDGSEAWVLNNYSVEKDAHGRLKRLQGFIIDFSDRIAMEHEMLEAKRLAELANRAKSDFLSAMSHELRTPLNAVLGFAQLLSQNKTGNLQADQLKYLDFINSSGKHLLRMINEVLDLSKIEAGKLELNREVFAIRPLIDEVLSSVSALVMNQGLQLRSNIAGDLGQLYADQGRIRQVLFNLLSNAIKFTGRGKTLGLDAHAGDGLLTISIWDEGVGIAEEDRQRIFDPFEQVRTHAKSNQGTGLGLSITQKLVSLHGGTISVESTLSKGSRFTITLPGQQASLALASQTQTSSQSGQVSVPETVEPAGTATACYHSTVLVVEDNPINQKLIAAILDSLQCSVVIADSGEEAWSLLMDRQFDLILMDINLPGMDGVETTRRIRRMEAKLAEKDGHRRNLPIIALTAHALRQDRDQFLAAGLTDVLTKPIELGKLTALLNLYLSKDADSENEKNKQIWSRPMKNQPQSDVYDIAAVAKSLNLPVEFLQELIKAFFTDIWLQYSTELETAIRAGAHSDIKNYAHKVKGAVANLRFLKTAELLGTMEKLALQGENADYAGLFADVKASIAGIEKQLAGGDAAGETIEELSDD